MQAVEFEVDSRNGIIKIPKRFKNLYSRHLKLIALFDEREEIEREEKSIEFNALRIKTKDCKFNRDEAHAR